MPSTFSIIAALVLMGLGGFLITQYGSAKFDAGALKCKTQQAESAAVAAVDTVSKKEGTQNENRKKKDDLIIVELRNAGWLRSSEDR